MNMRKHRRGRSGQALIEFVMIGSVFFTVVFFGVFYGHYINVKSLLNVASYSAARKFAITQNIENQKFEKEQMLFRLFL